MANTRHSRATRQPIPMAREEVEAKARGSEDAESVTRRIRREVPTKPLGRLVTMASTPAPISLREMRSIRRSGKPSASIARRLESAAGAEVPGRRARKGRKDEPREPPSKGRRR